MLFEVKFASDIGRTTQSIELSTIEDVKKLSDYYGEDLVFSFYADVDNGEEGRIIIYDGWLE